MMLEGQLFGHCFLYLFLLFYLVFVSPEEKTVKMHRRNSDSSLYCKAWYGEEPKERAIRPVTNQAKYLDQERLAFVQSYLEKAEDARSMTTETSDSGMPGTHGTASQLGMEDTTGTTKVFFPQASPCFLSSFSFSVLFLSLLCFPYNISRQIIHNSIGA